MSDDQVVSLDARRPRRLKPISAAATFKSHAFRLPFMKTHHEPRWTATGSVAVDGGFEVDIDASLVAHHLDDACPMGWVDSHEHGLTAEFVVGPEHAAMIQSVALSPVTFDVIVNFSADGEGSVNHLELSILRSPA